MEVGEFGTCRLEEGGDGRVDSGIGGGGFGEAVEFPVAEGFDFFFVAEFGFFGAVGVGSDVDVVRFVWWSWHGC